MNIYMYIFFVHIYISIYTIYEESRVERGATGSYKSGRARGCGWCSSGFRPRPAPSAPAFSTLLFLSTHRT